ncbi:MAG TPA: superinfection immunity protein [Stellaceae bacterium]|nr:superinfection immunity protein [Stellaceae bacterium]
MLGSTTTILMLLVIVLIYMLPTLIAFGREHPRREDVAVINILLGWTLIGWVACFLWASLAHVEDPLGS